MKKLVSYLLSGLMCFSLIIPLTTSVYAAGVTDEDSL